MRVEVFTCIEQGVKDENGLMLAGSAQQLEASPPSLQVRYRDCETSNRCHYTVIITIVITVYEL
jgi:hypothetical protein